MGKFSLSNVYEDFSCDYTIVRSYTQFIIIFISYAFSLFSCSFDYKIDSIKFRSLFFLFYPTISSFAVLALFFFMLFCQSDSNLFYIRCVCMRKKRGKKRLLISLLLLLHIYVARLVRISHTYSVSNKRHRQTTSNTTNSEQEEKADKRRETSV